MPLLDGTGMDPARRASGKFADPPSLIAIPTPKVWATRASVSAESALVRSSEEAKLARRWESVSSTVWKLLMSAS